ncbi:MAG: adenylate/guanylate cyclase domain-containing protein [Shimia sp.]|nr:adenylate/guanylate cyclase domain-containing protein [Shimia sp.]MCP4823077.1 adenylate/guanylate cyclase domain-containing protein [Shimia sp.]|mmetsp:Transcript_7293/g.12239  ORF Transcript_7293/g.12239 Transcript_7293/m.12239 type:complete len:336 (-) Transcript_7293:2292-3299(-)
MPSDIQRKLTTILAADAAGYSRVMEINEEEGLRALKASRAVFKKFIARHQGRVANTAGDGLIAEFPSVVEAVQCAIEVQRELGDQQQDPDMALNFRIGIHLGDVMVDGEDLLGEGVNLAARLQSMAEPGGILLSQQVYDQVRGKLTVGFDYIGERHPKNFSEGVQVYCVANMATSYPKMHVPEPKRPSSESAPQTAAPFTAKASSWPEDEFDEVLNKEPPQTAPADARDDDAEAALRARGKQFALIFGALCVIDMISGRGLWAHWPGLALLTAWLFQAAPLWPNTRFSPAMLRGTVVVAALVLINLFSWDGYFWAIWPAGALGFAALMRRTRKRT